jgi:flagellar biosynthetic protein FliR
VAALVAGVSGHADDIILVALQIGAPILVTLFISDIALGIVSRSVPQMNVFIVGLPLKIIVALGGIAILLPTTIAYFSGLSNGLIYDLIDLMKAAAP